MPRVVLITGVSRMVGRLAAQQMAQDDRIDRVIAVDSVPPVQNLGRAQFVRADIRNPIIGKIIAQEKVDTVLHLGVISTPRQAGGRTSQKEINVIGTMQLLAACQKADSLQRLVVKSSSVVYGSSAQDPAMFTEGMTSRTGPSGGYAKDSVEVETYVRGFARRRPDVQVSLLRFANVIGPGLRTPFMDYFASPVLPVPLGFDGRFQVIHVRDTIDAIQQAAHVEEGGIVNVAAPGMLSLRQAARIAGRPMVPVVAQAVSLVEQVTSRMGIHGFNRDELGFLSFGRGLDTTRMHDLLKFTPQFTTREAFVDVFAPARAMAGADRG